VVGDDGEKFGDWPGTNALCYGNGRESGWLHRFFEGLEDLSGELKTVLLCDEAKKTPLVQCDVPAGSYHEMNQWAGRNRQFSLNKPLSLSEAKRLQPAIWTNYLRRYREAGHLFGKMNQLSRDIARIADPHFRQKAEADLFDAQCNCAYWHGVFGGIYLPHLRIALHEKMISARKTVEYYFSEWLQEISNKEAEYAAKKQMDQFRAEFFQENYQSADLVDALYTYPKEKLLENRLPQIAPCICKVDYDHDGDKEIILRNKTMEVALDPKEGGSLFSLDFFPRNYPAAAVMSRIEEDYHKDFTGKLPNKQKTPPQVFDPWRRASFRDHVFSSVTLDELVELRYTECGSFANAPYTITKEDTSTLQLVHKGQIKPSTTQLPLTIKKEYSLEEDTILINYQLEYGEIPTLFFSPEINLLTMSTEGDRFLEVGKDRFSLADCRTISASKTLLVRDDYLQVGMEVSCSLPIDWHYLPIQSISRNFDQFEAIHQGFSLWPLLPIGEKNMNSTFTLRIRMTS
jgi:alpha-amylase